MEPPPNTAKVIRMLALPAMVVIAIGVYHVASAPPGGRQARIFAAVVAFATFAVIAILTVRKQTLSPENPRLSHWTLVWISLVVIILAVLFRKL